VPQNSKPSSDRLERNQESEGGFLRFPISEEPLPSPDLPDGRGGGSESGGARAVDG